MFSSYSFHQEFKFLKSKNKSGRLIGETEQSKALGKQFWEQSTCWPHVNCHLGEGTKWGHHSCLPPPSFSSPREEQNGHKAKRDWYHLPCQERKEKSRRKGEGVTDTVSKGLHRNVILQERKALASPTCGIGDLRAAEFGAGSSSSEPAFGESVMLPFQ